jgi:iron complex transport system substrate-binding protein
MRIVSLLPSATEIICALGLGDQLVGVTHECDYPPFVQQLPKVTKTLIPHNATSVEIDALVRERLKTDKALYTLNMEVLEQLRPDLIITQALCDVCAVAEAEVRAAACQLPGAPRVVNLEPMCLEDLYEAIRSVGEATGHEEAAERLIRSLRARVAAVKERTERIAYKPRVTLLEWIDPPFTCGHWSPELVALAGGIEGTGKAGVPSRTMHWEELLHWQPEVLVIACCGYTVERTLQDMPLLEARPRWQELPCVRSGRVYIINGSHYFSRPGPRLVDSLEILAHTLHPDVHPLPEGLPPALQWRAPALSYLP